MTHTFTIGRKRYEMPPMWAIGWCAAHNSLSIQDAALAWAEQEDLQQYAINQRALRGEIDIPTHDAGQWS